MPLSGFERETVINLNDAEDFAEVYTAQRRIITKLKANPLATLIEEGKHDGSAWARFEIPSDRISFLRTRRKGHAGGFQKKASGDDVSPDGSGGVGETASSPWLPKKRHPGML